MTTEKLYLGLYRQGCSFVTIVARRYDGSAVLAPYVASISSTGEAFLYKNVLQGSDLAGLRPFMRDGHGRVQVAEGR